MIMKAEILRLLRETDGYVSGQELCNQFGVSRTAVWKAINQLKEAGYEIEAVQNKGYHLVSMMFSSSLLVIMITGTVGQISFINARVCRPLSPGMFSSRKIRS